MSVFNESTPPPTLQELRSDGEAAWAAAYPRLRSAGLISARTTFFGTSHDHEDIVQNALRDLWKALVLGTSLAWVTHWEQLATQMTLFCRRRAIDLLRHRSRRPEYAVEELPEPTHSPPVEFGNDAARAWTLLEELNPPKPALIADRFNGYTDEEISQRHDLPKGTVQSHIFRGLKILRQLWHERNCPVST